MIVVGDDISFSHDQFEGLILERTLRRVGIKATDAANPITSVAPTPYGPRGRREGGRRGPTPCRQYSSRKHPQRHEVVAQRRSSLPLHFPKARVLVTPLRIMPEAPEADQTNRVLRQYGYLVNLSKVPELRGKPDQGKLSVGGDPGPNLPPRHTSTFPSDESRSHVRP
ncbi:hypothetical protein H257_00600 [Aphanomyces astaci]|uniref:Uncharacterized protein n=1 Tax=Aphanomyces astaci TaxID=112090 RepID=W4HDM8_APHAT|nr:hypothetical protein H257_00600 [Aphanomyces astaci]ETV89243.1 hypothetical protein H257_00600 [Aphanomyces astaci]|eukprot:XP_009821643.1 hypothetical protein H257_00600 [Aphanomyces astaci]